MLRHRVRSRLSRRPARRMVFEVALGTDGWLVKDGRLHADDGEVGIHSPLEGLDLDFIELGSHLLEGGPGGREPAGDLGSHGPGVDDQPDSQPPDARRPGPRVGPRAPGHDVQQQGGIGRGAGHGAHVVEGR